ncbi:MAG: DeoR/GlpR family DNA-binding transcription regulator [Acidimicrobiales bacterium]
MIVSLRRRRITEEIRHRGAIRVVELAEIFDVSEMTIRRDLEVLQESGLLTKVRGGAVRAEKSAEEPGFITKLSRAAAEKLAIAKAALSLVEPGSSVAISAGTTTWAFARLLPSIPGVTVITNSISIATELHSNHPELPLILTGGVPTPSGGLVGLIADTAIESLYVDILFLGVHGMDPEAGFTTPNLAEAKTNRTLLSCARRTVVLADHTKWRTIGMARIAPFDAADVLVTDDQLPDEACRSLQDAVGELIIAPTETPHAGEDVPFEEVLISS